MIRSVFSGRWSTAHGQQIFAGRHIGDRNPRDDAGAERGLDIEGNEIERHEGTLAEVFAGDRERVAAVAGNGVGDDQLRRGHRLRPERDTRNRDECERA